MKEKSKAPKNLPEKTAKKHYRKPALTSESLMTFGALCNGTTSGQRKQSTGAPNFCSASKLLS